MLRVHMLKNDSSRKKKQKIPTGLTRCVSKARSVVENVEIENTGPIAAYVLFCAYSCRICIRVEDQVTVQNRSFWFCAVTAATLEKQKNEISTYTACPTTSTVTEIFNSTSKIPVVDGWGGASGLVEITVKSRHNFAFSTPG